MILSHLFMWDNEAATITGQIPECKMKPRIIPKFADYNFFLFIATIISGSQNH